MLNIEKSTTLIGYATIDGTNVVYLNATIKSSGNNGTITKNILNQDLYNKNRTVMRSDMTEFENKVFTIEDEMDLGIENVVNTFAMPAFAKGSPVESTEAIIPIEKAIKKER